jgi:hypothetical protein
MAGVQFNSNITFGFSLAHSAGNAAEARTGAIASGYAANIGLGDPIVITAAGLINAVTGDTDGAAINGVFLGVQGLQESDPFDVRIFRKNWVSGTVTKGAANTKALYVPAKGNLFIARAAAGQTITQALLGDLLAATPGAPDAYGNSTLSIDATSTPVGVGTATVRVVDLVQNPAGGFAAFVVELVNAA